MACRPCSGHRDHTTCSTQRQEGWRGLLAWLFTLPQRTDHFYKYQQTDAEQNRRTNNERKHAHVKRFDEFSELVFVRFIRDNKPFAHYPQG